MPSMNETADRQLGARDADPQQSVESDAKNLLTLTATHLAVTNLSRKESELSTMSTFLQS